MGAVEDSDFALFGIAANFGDNGEFAGSVYIMLDNMVKGGRVVASHEAGPVITEGGGRVGGGISLIKRRCIGIRWCVKVVRKEVSSGER